MELHVNTTSKIFTTSTAEFEFMPYDDIIDMNQTKPNYTLGDLHDPLSAVIPITVVYLLIFVSGLVGNICTCAVIIRNRHMRTATNYYLFSLAISDLLLLVMGLPPELYLLWFRYPFVFGEAFCILRGFTSEMSTNASILTITCFTMERYLAICHPIRAHTMSKLSRVVKMICAVWIIGGLCAVPLAVQFGLIYTHFNGKPVPGTSQCSVKNLLKNAFVSSTFCFFIIPMGVISVLYALLGIELHKSESSSRIQSPKGSVLNGNSDGQFSLKKLHLARMMTRQSTRSIKGTKVSSRKAVIKMLFAVVVAFFVCWAPFHGQRLMAIYSSETLTAAIVYKILTHISGVTYYVSATINPILYSIMSNKFRAAFKQTLAHCCRKNVSYNRGSSRYISVLRSSSLPKSNSCGKNKRHDSAVDIDIENNHMSKQEFRYDPNLQRDSDWSRKSTKNNIALLVGSEVT